MISRFSSVKSAVLVAATLCVLALPAAADPSTHIALVPGGPHPYFAAWEKAGQDAKKDFNLGAADYRVPQKWELSEQNQLLESLLSQNYNAFLVFPGDPVGSNSTVAELADNGAQSLRSPAASRSPQRRSSALGRTPATPRISALRN
jgi:ribose transport system substrate-binding protein